MSADITGLLSGVFEVGTPAAPDWRQPVTAADYARDLCTLLEQSEEKQMSDHPDNRLSIAELQRETARWPSRWRPALGEEGEWSGFWWCDDHNGAEERVSVDPDEDYANDLALRIADLANATPVLLEIAAVALALREQEQAAAKLRHALSDKFCPSDLDYETSYAADTELMRRRGAYRAALAKVRQ